MTMALGCPEPMPILTDEEPSTAQDLVVEPIIEDATVDVADESIPDVDQVDVIDVLLTDNVQDPIEEVTLECGPRAYPQAGACVCNDEYLESSEGDCVLCFENSHCGDQVCIANTCRPCLQHTECGPDRFCGERGQCASSAPTCLVEDDRRCANHALQYCHDGLWVDDTTGECPAGCDDLTGECYDDINVGWIGGHCMSSTDCDRISAGAICLSPDDGFRGGMCSQPCAQICPAQGQPTDSPAYCIDSSGLLEGSLCVSGCDYETYTDAGCRPGYECRHYSLVSGESDQMICLPINWLFDPSRRFKYGTMVADVSESTALLWTQSGDVETSLVVHYGLEPDVLSSQASGQSEQSRGFTTEVSLSDLQPSTQYFYQVVLDGWVTSPLGRFQTAPALTGEDETVQFLVSSEIAVHGIPLNRFDIFDSMRELEADFFVSLGGWPWVDHVAVLFETVTGSSHDVMVDAYRDEYQNHRSDSRLINFLRDQAVFAIFNDQEVRDDWDANYISRRSNIVAAALQVWQEWFPVDADVAGEFYRSFRWGELEFFILDVRTMRSARIDFDDATKTMLGNEQYSWLVDSLVASDAVFKFVLTTVPLDFATTDQDSWTGYSTERNTLLQTIINNDLEGVIFLSADQRWFSANHHNVGLKEFQVGPLTAGVRSPPTPDPLHAASVIAEHNFGRITYTPTDGGRLLFEGFAANGDLLYSEIIPAGRGQVEVDANLASGFTLCSASSSDQPCAHIFSGTTPALFEYATPGPYQISWQPLGSYSTPAAERLLLQDGQTIRFEGDYIGGLLPFADSFDDELAWVAVDEGGLYAPSRWELQEYDGETVLAQLSNIHDLYTSLSTEDSLNPDHIPKLGTLAFAGNSEWTNYELNARFTTSDDDAVGFLVRYRDQDNYYRFSLDHERRYARLVRRFEGEFELLEELIFEDDDIPYGLDEWTSIRLRAHEDTLQAFIGAREVISVTDDSEDRIEDGAVGLYCWSGEGVYFDDISVVATE